MSSEKALPTEVKLPADEQLAAENLAVENLTGADISGAALGQMPTKPRGFSGPGSVMLLCLATAGAAFATTLPKWISTTVTTVLGPHSLNITGKDASAAVSALAIVAVMGAVALRIAGPKVRWVIAALMALAGIGIASSAWGVINDPAQASLAKVSAITGTNSVAGDYSVTLWPWLTIVCGLLVTLAALWAGFASRKWPAKRKYERTALAETGEDLDEIDTWDSLSAGKDPTL